MEETRQLFVQEVTDTEVKCIWQQSGESDRSVHIPRSLIEADDNALLSEGSLIVWTPESKTQRATFKLGRAQGPSASLLADLAKQAQALNAARDENKKHPYLHPRLERRFKA